jgi:hypothetical protein
MELHLPGKKHQSWRYVHLSLLCYNRKCNRSEAYDQNHVRPFKRTWNMHNTLIFTEGMICDLSVGFAANENNKRER